MTITPIFDPANSGGRPMRVAAFMSGSGTNIMKLLEHQKALASSEGSSPFEVIFIFSDRSDGMCSGEKIALDNGIPYFSYDIRAFHQQRSLKRSCLAPEGLEARRQYDAIAKRLIEAFEIDVIALGGYMSYITLNRCVNVHPADLSIVSAEGRRVYVGDNAVRDAILAGEKTLRASILWTDDGVDTGPLLMVSEPIPVETSQAPETLLQDRDRFQAMVDEHQGRLKEAGDWKIFPKTIEMIARGRFAIDEYGRVYVDGMDVPYGYRE
ncbi:Formyl transferase [uncultured Desulfobacterium sp.]|uniref:phosphoribosylglycinamide formyltransferase 1 n=1 Tax=uncultured Desulfobacterium sp. TaxID=201089 RepID=A0A445MTT8_9BACT|nr:Formyl transferase [uncultured Desulfobacterium sp.]